MLATAPALIGAFWGAPLVARELESGTYRVAWTQSVTRTRWLATKLGITALATAVAVGALSLAVTWWAKPLDGSRSDRHGNLPDRMTPISFAMRGVVPVGYAVFALVLGVAVGLVLRRTLPAMAITLAVYVAVQVVVPLWVRPHLLPPTTESVAISGKTLDGILLEPGGPLTLTVHTDHHGDWVLSNSTVDSHGDAVALPSWFADCLPGPPAPGATTRVHEAGPRAPLDDCLARLDREGYSQRVVYQPATRFWALQGVETGLYLAVAGLLTAGCFWWTRRRLS